MNDWKILVEILSGYGILQILEGSCLVVIRLFLHLYQVLSQSGTLLASEELGSKFGNAGKSSFSEDLFFLISMLDALQHSSSVKSTLASRC